MATAPPEDTGPDSVNKYTDTAGWTQLMRVTEPTRMCRFQSYRIILMRYIGSRLKTRFGRNLADCADSSSKSPTGRAVHAW